MPELDDNTRAHLYALAFVNGDGSAGEQRLVEQKEREFLKWLREVRAQAWAQGFDAGYEDQRFRDTTKRHPDNPHEEA